MQRGELFHSRIGRGGIHDTLVGGQQFVEGSLAGIDEGGGLLGAGGKRRIHRGMNSQGCGAAQGKGGGKCGKKSHISEYQLRF
jgi:hypothetical protein